MAPLVESSSSVSSPSESTSRSDSSSSRSWVELPGRGPLIWDAKNRSMEQDDCEREDSTVSTGQKGEEGEELSRPSISSQSEHVSIANSKGTRCCLQTIRSTLVGPR